MSNPPDLKSVAEAGPVAVLGLLALMLVVILGLVLRSRYKRNGHDDKATTALLELAASINRLVRLIETDVPPPTRARLHELRDDLQEYAVRVAMLEQAAEAGKGKTP